MNIREKINERNPALSESRVGDFIGDTRADIFYADGNAGGSPMAALAHSSILRIQVNDQLSSGLGISTAMARRMSWASRAASGRSR